MKREINPNPKIACDNNVLNFLSKCCHLDIELMKIFKFSSENPKLIIRHGGCLLLSSQL